MPTKHRRIAIIRDPEVAEALRRARGNAPNAPRTDAALARELVIRGASAVEEENGRYDEYQRELIARGGTPAKGTMREALEEMGPLPPFDPDDPYPAQRILKELREDTV